MKTYFNSFSDVDAFFSERGDEGYSNKIYYSCNLGLNTGDDKEVVLQNRNEFLSNLDKKVSDAAFADQRHTKNVALVDHPSVYPECDALITNLKNVPLLIQVADCACVYLYDASKKAIGLVHSGWKGTEKKIVTKTIQLMKKEFGSDYGDIYVVISPCISGSVFEVGEDVYLLFPTKYFTEKPNGKYLFDMKHCLNDEIKAMGVQDIHIDTDCTYSDPSSYFSYRRDREKSGRMMGCLMLK